MSDKGDEVKRADKKVPHWVWPIGLSVAGIGAAAAVLLRGCWHRNMSWPVRHGEHAFRTCNDCGIMRLFDEKTFRPYGPYGYDLDKLIATHEERRQKRMAKGPKPPDAPDDFAI